MAYGNNSYGAGSGAVPVLPSELFDYAGPAYGAAPYAGDASTSGPPPAPPVTTDVAGAGARDQRGAAGGAALVPANDDFVARINLAGTSGSTPFIVQNATLEASEPAQAITTGTATVWFTWTPGYLGTGTISSDSGIIVDAFLDADGTLVDVVGLAGSPASVHSITFDVRPGETYAIRAYGTSATDSAVHTLNWSVALAPLDFTLASTAIPWAPGSVYAYVANDTPSSTVNLSFDGGATVQTVTTDTEGYVSFPLNIPALTVGTHTVTATSSSGRVGTVSFSVLASGSFVPPTPPPPPSVGPPVVNRWQFQDPVTDEIWVFPINPITEGSPILPRVLTPHWTAARDGQPIVFEGGRIAKTWQLTGTFTTLADLNALRGWQRPYRVYLTDDLGRAFVVKVHQVTSQPPLQSIDPELPEAYKYTINLLVFERVVGGVPTGVGP